MVPTARAVVLPLAGEIGMVESVGIFILILLVLLLANVVWWLLTDFALRRRGCGWSWRTWPLALALGMGGLLAFWFFSRGTGVAIHGVVPTAVIAALYLWYLVVLPASLLLALGLAGLAIFSRRGKPESAGDHGPGWDRRRFVSSLAVTGPPALLLGATLFSLPQLRHFRVRRFDLALPGLPAALDGLTIAHVSDTHVGSFTYGETLRAIARATNALEADLVLLTGDIINNDLRDLPAAIEMVRSMRARHGVFMCEGNHDLIPGPGHFEREVKAAGIDLLVNETRTISIDGQRVQLLGLRWGSGGRMLEAEDEYGESAIEFSLHELLQRRDAGAFPILMAHHPHAFDLAAEQDIPLVVAGHTHGGQLMINENLGFGPAMFRYWSGIYRKGESALAVSNGVGNWFPLRTAAPAEILHLTLRTG